MVHKNRKLPIPRKTTLVLWVILAFFSPNPLQPFQLAAAESPLTLSDNRQDGKAAIIIRSHQIAAYDEAIKGFQEGCKGKGIIVKTIYDLNGDAETGKKIIQGIQNDNPSPDLILAVGVLAATLAKEYFADTPILFCLVINHERFNFQGSNITGISAEASVEDQFLSLKELLGAQKRVGVIYDPLQTENIVVEAVSIAKRHDFTLTTKKVSSEKEVAAALDAIINKIDVLWMIPDSTVITKEALTGILKKVQKQRIPTFCTSSAIVKAGALASISIDYNQTGFQAADIAESLLSHNTAISLGIRRPEKLKWTLNSKTAKWLGINIAPFESRSNVTFYP